MVPPLSQNWLFFTNFGKGLSQIVGFFLIFEPILLAGFSDKMLVLSKFHNFAQIVFEKSLFY